MKEKKEKEERTKYLSEARAERDVLAEAKGPHEADAHSVVSPVQLVPIRKPHVQFAAFTPEANSTDRNEKTFWWRLGWRRRFGSYDSLNVMVILF